MTPNVSQVMCFDSETTKNVFLSQAVLGVDEFSATPAPTLLRAENVGSDSDSDSSSTLV